MELPDRTPTTRCHAFLDKPMHAAMDTQLIFTLTFATQNNPAPPTGFPHRSHAPGSASHPRVRPTFSEHESVTFNCRVTPDLPNFYILACT